MTLSKELEKRIRGYLKQVASHLQTAPADERGETLAYVESRVREKLHARNPGNPASADLDAVLAEMDPPESYGQSGVEPGQNRKPSRATVKSKLRLFLPIFCGAVLITILILTETPPFADNTMRRELARVRCMGNLQSLSVIFELYAADNGGMLPSFKDKETPVSVVLKDIAEAGYITGQEEIHNVSTCPC
jgi:hypothetical protein